MEKRSGNVDMGSEAKFENLGMNVLNECNILELCTRFKGEKNGEGIERNRLTMHLGVEKQSFTRGRSIFDGQSPRVKKHST